MRSLFINCFCSDNSSKKRTSEAGFTLIEMLVATAVIAILSGSLMVLVEQINRTMVQRRAYSDIMVNQHIAAIDFEIQLKRLFRPGLLERPTESGWRLIGGGGNYTLDDYGMDRGFDEIGCQPASVDRLAGYESVPEGRDRSDRRSIFFFLGSDRSAYIQHCAFRRRAQESYENAEQLFPDFDDNLARQAGFHLADNVDMIIFRFYDPAAGWVEQWDSRSGDQQDRMPQAVEYAFRTFNPGGHVTPQWFRGIVRLSPRQ